MNPKQFGLMVAAWLISDIAASLFIALKLRALRNGQQTRIVTLLSYVFLGTCIRGTCHLIAEGIGISAHPIAYWSVYWIGRAAQTIPFWWTVIYLIGFRGKTKVVDTGHRSVN